MSYATAAMRAWQRTLDEGRKNAMSFTKATPIGDHVALRVLPRENKTAAGIILVERSGREDRGEVLARGAGMKHAEPLVGEVVGFDPYKVRLVIDADGADVTSSMHARAGSIAIVPEDALRYVIVPDDIG